MEVCVVSIKVKQEKGFTYFQSTYKWNIFKI